MLFLALFRALLRALFLALLIVDLLKIGGDGKLNEPALVKSFLNSIMLQVSVPVLSENMYSIWPNSSFMFVV